MNTKTKFFHYLFSLILFSCISLEREKIEQIYPDFDFRDIIEIKVKNDITEKRFNLKETKDLDSFSTLMNDSQNYFLKDSITLEGAKSMYSLSIISVRDTLNLTIFPVKDQQKIELAFFEDYDLKRPDSFRKLNRFYMTLDFLDFIKSKESDSLN